MRVIDSEGVAKALPYVQLVSALRDVYKTSDMAADRKLYFLPELGREEGTCMATMPAWGPGHDIVAKVFTLFPDNRDRGLPTVHAVILIFDGKNGVPKAIVDGTEVTRRRTAAMCALASDYLSRKDSSRLLVCGAGALAPHAALAHAAVRPIKDVDIWARRPEAAEDVVKTVLASRPDLNVNVVLDLPAAAHSADIVSCQTSSPEPLVFGEWLRPGTHTDFVGSHDDDKRECDDEVARKSRIWVDVMESAMREAGDILIPLKSGVITRQQIIGDLSDLSSGRVRGRESEGENTMFKSTGSSLADLAAAELAVKNCE